MDWTYQLKQINQIAIQWWKVVGSHKVFAFHGPMGVGKTTFIHALCSAKGVKDVVTSPTFSLVNEYKLPHQNNGTLFHIDLYRIQDEQEAIRAGIEDCLYSGKICLVEWPDKAPHIFPEDTVHVYLNQIDMKTREVKVQFPDLIL